MSKEVITVVACDWCGDDVNLPSKKRRVRGYTEADYPESWKNVEGDIICVSCKRKYFDMVRKLKIECSSAVQKKKNKTNGKKQGG